MAMTPDGMADAILVAMKAAYGIVDGEADAKKYFSVVSTGIINYLKTSMDVLPGSFSNTGGPVAGTGKVS